MRILIINEVLGWSSTGKIAGELARQYESEGWEVKVAYGRSGYVPEAYQKYGIRIGNDLEVKINALKARMFDNEGLNAGKSTKQFLRWADEYNPDLLWLHNLHGYYINYDLLFKWIKFRPQMEVKWTLHDCWAFTGHCAYFTMVNCSKWKEGCHNCPQKHNYPKSIIDYSNRNYILKKAAFVGVSKMTLITPSEWLAKLVKNSFLNGYSVEVQHNKIDTSIFKPTSSDFRKIYNLEDKIIVLGVANVWDKRKGLDDFLELAAVLPDEYKIILVGLSAKQLKHLPENIIGLSKTNSLDELVKIYSAADVFVNTTYEDNYPTVNLEAQACGTPVITYNTGGSPESVPVENVVKCGDVLQLKQAIIKKNYI